MWLVEVDVASAMLVQGCRGRSLQMCGKFAKSKTHCLRLLRSSVTQFVVSLFKLMPDRSDKLHKEGNHSLLLFWNVAFARLRVARR